ncbi:hypothetical protein V496_02324 [Pseudogymnoascus sp. VKM F-4515 (FW-2607)]|nr:hypothetical protein V496_02324 [Pseudogymnoascus sp. VKM F-4515 (FW-2607)]KFY90501.1 hypothetical protein V498_05897 [Pseudogymnoascus sp. VKM F-4517 (FW-2822)]
MKFSVLTTVAAVLAASTSVTALPVSESPSMIARAELETRATCSKAATDKLIFKVSINSFEKARKAKNPSKCNWSSDGCSWSPDKPDGYNFLPSCHRHDFGYRNTKSQKRFTKAMKKKIDNNFKSDLYRYCARFSGLSSWKGVECRRLADVYVAFVRKLGKRDQIGDVAFTKRENNIFDIELDEDIEGQEIPDVLPEDEEGEDVDEISKREVDEEVEEIEEVDIFEDEDIEEDEISKRDEDSVLEIAVDEDIEGQDIPDVLPEGVEGDEVEDLDAYLGEEEE